jgi:nucleotide-binding universal stress UspA family protein
VRVLLASDGSPGAAQAAAAAGSTTWPDDSILRVVSVVDADVGVAIDDHVQSQLDDVVRSLARPGRSVESAVLRGRPARVIVDEAHRFRADLVIVGSRGHGPVSSLVLGSVSAEVVDHAPCPVLVARQPHIERAVLATDDSPAALYAEAILSQWRMFAEVPIRVVSVADVVLPWSTGIAPTMYQQVVDTYARDLEHAKSEHLRVAEESAARLRAHGRRAESNMRAGDAAAQIISAASEWDADLIVLGSRGRTGLARVLLGSVARNVLHGSQASVLIVRSAVEADLSS